MATILLCELRAGGRIHKRPFENTGFGLEGEPATLEGVEMALHIARKMALQPAHGPCWIERTDQPASRLTLEAAARWQLLTSNPEATH